MMFKTFLIIAAVLVAPHMPWNEAKTWSLVSLFLALVFMFIEVKQ